MSYAVSQPYVSTFHPYPTRFHGGLWTRPVFKFPFVQSPQSVFKCNDFNDGNPKLSGLGLDYNVGNGVFGSAKDGGGVFGPSLYGLQGVALGGQSDDIDAIASYILNTPTSSPAAFDIQAEFRRWYNGLGPYEKNFSSDIAATASNYRTLFNKANVVSASAPSSAPAPAASADAFSKTTITNLQKTLNTVLAKAGYNTITADGALGPGTCGAIQTYRGLTGDVKAGVSYDAVCATKTPWRLPTKRSSSVSPALPVAPPPEPMQAGMFGGAGTWAMIGGGVLAVGLAVVGKKKGWF